MLIFISSKTEEGAAKSLQLRIIQLRNKLKSNKSCTQQ